MLRTTLLLSAALLSLQGCKDKDTITGGSSEAVAAIDIDNLSDSVVAAHFAVAPRTTPASESERALREMNLWDKTDQVIWDSRSEADGTYTYKNVKMTGDDGAVSTIGTLTLIGVHEGEDGPSADKLVAKNVSVAGDDGTVRIAALTLMDPELERALDDATLDLDYDLSNVRALALEGLNMSERKDGATADTTITLANFAFAKPMTADSADGFFTLKDLSVTGQDSVPFSMTLDSASMMGGRDLEAISQASRGPGSALSPLAMNPANVPFEAMKIGKMELNADTLDVDFDGLQITNVSKGDTLTARSAMEPLTIRFTEAPTNAELAQAYTAFNGLGYEEIVLSGAGEGTYDRSEDRYVSEGGFFQMKDGFRITVDSDLRGMAAAEAARDKVLREAGFDPDMDADLTDMSDERSNAYFDAQMAAGKAARDALQLGGLNIALTDQSIVDRGFQMAAEMQGTSPRMLRMQAKGLIAMGAMFTGDLGIDPELAQQALTAVGEYIDTPGATLRLQIDPDRPVTFDSIGQMNAEELGFVARVEK